MDGYRIKRFFSHWVVMTVPILVGLVLLGVFLWPTDPIGHIPKAESRPSSRSVISNVFDVDTALQPRELTLPPLINPTALTMPLELNLTPEEQQLFRLVEWLPLTSTVSIQNDAEHATAMVAAFNRLRVDAGMSPLVADDDLMQRAGTMTRSRLAFRLYDEGSTVFRSHQIAWLAAFGVTEGGPLSLDMLPLPAAMITARDDPQRLAVVLRGGAYGSLVSDQYTRIGVGVGRVDGWDTGGTLIILFY